MTSHRLLIYCINTIGDNEDEGYYESCYDAFGKIWKAHQIDQGLIWFKTDEFGKRLHTNLTALNRDLKKFITYNDQPLVSIDVKNSQPYMGIKVVLDYIQGTNTPSLPGGIMLLKYHNHLDIPDVKLYIDLVSNGGFYEYMEQQVRKELGDKYFEQARIYDHESDMVVDNDKSPRDRMKGVMYQVLFSKNESKTKEKEIFRKSFPNVMDAFEKIKGNPNVRLDERHKALSRQLQRLESELILNVTTRQIAAKNGSIPLFTVHDSIITTLGNENVVQETIEDTFKKAIGYIPTLDVQYLGNSKLERIAA